jgi:hypothetical protein
MPDHPPMVTMVLRDEIVGVSQGHGDGSQSHDLCALCQIRSSSSESRSIRASG